MKTNPFTTTSSTRNSRAMLVGVRIRNWSGKKYDKEMSEAAIAAFSADPASGRFSKNCIPSTTKVQKMVEKVIKSGKKKGQKKVEAVTIETNSLIELNQHLAETRRWYYDQTLEWATGWRVLPVANHPQFLIGWRERLNKFNQLLPVFVADYPDLVRMSRGLLNGAWKEKDYPTDIAGEFELGIDWDQLPEPGTGDVRIDLAAADIAVIEASIAERCNSGWQKAQNSAVTRLYDALKRIHDRLSSTRVSKRKGDEGEVILGTFKDTLIENAREICDVLTRLNVADDPELERYRRETELLAAVEPETLRNSADVAKETAARADDLIKRMTETYGADLFKGLK